MPEEYAAPGPTASPETHNADESKSVVKARKRLQQAIEATNQNRLYQVDDLKFAAGSPDNKYQWPSAVVSMREGDPNGPRPVLTINKLPQHIFQITNEQRQNRPSIKVSPVDDKGDKEVAEVLEGIIRHIEYMSDAEIAYSIAGENQVQCGEGYIRVLTDYVEETSFEQDIRICQLRNSFSVYMDPIGLQKDSTGRYCDWAFVTQDLSREEYEREFGKAAKVNWELVGTGDEWKAWFPDSDTVRIAEYFERVYETKKIYLWSDGSVTTEDDPLHGQHLAVEQPIKEREAQISKIRWCKMSGFKELESSDWAGNFIPIVRCAGNEWYIDGKMIVSGIVRNAKDAQRMFNYWKSTETETLALAPKAPFIGPAEAFEGYETDWQQANTKNFAYLKYNQWSEGDKEIARPQSEQPPMPPVGIVNAALGAADDIKSATGQYDPSLGNNAQAKSGVALAREQRKTDIGTFQYIDNQARAIRQLGRILVDLIPKIYDTARIARILGEDGEADQAMLNPDMPQAVTENKNERGEIQKIYNPSIGRYDVTVSVGPGYTSKRQEAAEFMAQVLQGNKELMSVIGDLYFEMMDVPGADAIAERLKKTLPAQLQEPKEEDKNQPLVMTPQGPMRADKASQMMADMMQALQHQAEQIETIDQEKQRKEAIAEENRQRDLAIKAESEETARLKAKVEAEQKERELDIRAFEATTTRMGTKAEIKLKVGEALAKQTEENAEEKAEEQNLFRDALAAFIEQMNASHGVLAEAVNGLAQAQGAPTETQILEYDNDGIPTRTRTTRMIQ